MNAVTLKAPANPRLPTQQMRAQFNNNMAQALASGDPRFNAKQYDRPGFSRGAGLWNQAGIDAAKSLSEGIASAYAGDLQNQQANALAGLQSATDQESQAQSLGALQQQHNYANQMAALQRQQAGVNLVSSLLGGLLR
jgi:hypothetical protein